MINSECLLFGQRAAGRDTRSCRVQSKHGSRAGASLMLMRMLMLLLLLLSYV